MHRTRLVMGLGFGLLLVLGMVLVWPASAEPTTERRVCPTGCAYSSVQAAVDAAAPGDVIAIAAGAYTEVTTRNGLQQAVYITKSLTLRGGYRADFAARDPQVYSTTLDAQGQGRVLYIDGTAITGSITVTLDGLRITGGRWSSSEYVTYNDLPPDQPANGVWWAPPGGGVRVQRANVTLLDSTLYDNHTFNGLGSGLFQHYGTLNMQRSTVKANSGTGDPYEPGIGDCGGGLFLLQATASISNSFILTNSAGYGDEVSHATDAYGGGIFLSYSTALIEQTTIQGNVASRHDSGWGGGLYSEYGTVSLFDSRVMSNTAALVYSYYGQQGGGAYLVPYSGGAADLRRNLFQGNTNGGIVAYGPITVTDCTFTGNTFQSNAGRSGAGVALSGSGVFQNNRVISNTATGPGGGATFGGALAVIHNTFQDNTAGGDGGGLLANGAISLLGNTIEGNTASGCGGGLLVNSLALEDGDLFRNNTAWYGGGLCLKGASSGIVQQNLVVAGNRATVSGCGIYVDRSGSVAATLRHLTISGNNEGDGSGVYVNAGAVSFVNTILSNQEVGAQNVGGNPSFDHTLRYQVLTPTVGVMSDVFAISGNPAFAADGYHLTQASAAIDRGVATPTSDDIDGEVRPQGQAPDLGADESPYTRGADTGVQVSKEAGAPQWITQWSLASGATVQLLQQDYLIPFSYGGMITSPALSALSIVDTFPGALQLHRQESLPEMSFSQAGGQLTWRSAAALAPGTSGWVGIIGQASGLQPGQALNNTAKAYYTLEGGKSFTVSLQASTIVPERPLAPPLITSPADGEMCLDEAKRLEMQGLTYVGMPVKLYENGMLKGSATSDASGVFTITWSSALTLTQGATLYAVVCDPAQPSHCSAPSHSVHLEYPLAFWCPQRSFWEGNVGGMHYLFHFVNEQGRYATNDFELPGVYGFSGTQLHLYSCCDRDTNPFTVIADGTTYTTPSAHVGHMWTFTIGAAHTVIVESQCQVGGRTSHGRILIDPDGYVFDQTQGGGYSATTQMYVPVKALPGITVTAYISVPEWGGWVPWPAQLYQQQKNPQVTGASGYFAFFTPPGTYYLQAEVPEAGSTHYQAWRSPVIQVITQVVHMNIPLTPLATGSASAVALTQSGPNPKTITVSLGSSVQWLATLGASATVSDVQRYNADPLLHPRSVRDPLTDMLGFDGGMLVPGAAYRRQFNTAGTYAYSDGAGHSGQIVVTEGHLLLPLVLRH
jgi:hypothetical protein